MEGAGGSLFIDSSTVYIKNTTFFQNKALNYRGGAIHLKGSKVFISDC